MVFLCTESGDVIVSSSTRRPNSQWVVQQTEAFIEPTADKPEKPSIVMHDRDTKFTKEFLAALKTGMAFGRRPCRSRHRTSMVGAKNSSEVSSANVS